MMKTWKPVCSLVLSVGLGFCVLAVLEQSLVAQNGVHWSGEYPGPGLFIAQDDFPGDFPEDEFPPGAGAAGGATICMVCGCYIMIPVLVLAINGVCAFVVYRDANKHGVDNAVLWAVVAFLTNWVGLLIYFLVIKKQHMEKMGK